MGAVKVTEEKSADARDIDFLHEIGSRMAAADPFHVVLQQVVEFVVQIARCDSCFVYVLEGSRLVMRASKNPHAESVDHVHMALGQGITGWVAQNVQTVAISTRAFTDPRFKALSALPEDRFEAFLSVPILSRNKVVGVINVQHRKQHQHSAREIRLISTVGFLVGAEIELARIESQKAALESQLETRKALERAKGILQRELKIDEEAAYLALQKESRQRRKTIREIAEALILSDEFRRRAK
jgi:signal transduction protein with GAF and PtsI domain